jgi:hypothetical protein
MSEAVGHCDGAESTAFATTKCKTSGGGAESALHHAALHATPGPISANVRRGCVGRSHYKACKKCENRIWKIILMTS